jgi:hypothetical protein
MCKCIRTSYIEIDRKEREREGTDKKREREGERELDFGWA